MGRILAILVPLIAIALYYYMNQEVKLPENYRYDHYWGDEELDEDEKPPEDNKQMTTFEISVHDQMLTDYKARIGRTKVTESLKNTNCEYGINSNALKQILLHWANDYDWRAHEKILNQYIHHQTEIEGLNIHFVRVPAKAGAKVIYPLMLIHGWPSTFYEFYKVADILATPVNGVAYEIIIPSLPGYAWSDAPGLPGCNAIHVARIFSKIMTRLGYARFYLMGTDWGSVVGKAMSVLHPSRIAGFYTTLPWVHIGIKQLMTLAVGEFMPGFVYDEPLIDWVKVHPVSKTISNILRETGYMHLQMTKPDTIGYALLDSPSGIAAYILEKYSTWTNAAYTSQPDGGLIQPGIAKFTMDELCTNLMIYWTTRTIATSMRFYKENVEVMHLVAKLKVSKEVPVAIGSTPSDLYDIYPKALLVHSYANISHYTNFPRGGHFMAFEEPKLLADDMRAFFAKTKFL